MHGNISDWNISIIMIFLSSTDNCEDESNLYYAGGLLYMFKCIYEGYLFTVTHLMKIHRLFLSNKQYESHAC